MTTLKWLCERGHQKCQSTKQVIMLDFKINMNKHVCLNLVYQTVKGSIYQDFDSAVFRNVCPESEALMKTEYYVESRVKHCCVFRQWVEWMMMPHKTSLERHLIEATFEAFLGLRTVRPISIFLITVLLTSYWTGNTWSASARRDSWTNSWSHHSDIVVIY